MPSSSDSNKEGSWRELAELEALGLLGPEERLLLDSAVKSGDALAVAARERAAKLVGAIGFAAPSSFVPAGARDRVMKAVLLHQEPQNAQIEGSHPTQIWKNWTAEQAGENPIIYKNDQDWVEIDVPGIRVRKLNVDPRARVVTMLIRMDAGTSYPPHRHGGNEECYVLEGDLRVGEKLMNAGDYQCANQGTMHPVQSTRGGCLLFIRSSMSDEIVV